MLTVFILSVVKLNVSILSDVMLNLSILSDVMLNVFILSDVMLNVSILIAVMLNVKCHYAECRGTKFTLLCIPTKAFSFQSKKQIKRIFRLKKKRYFEKQ